MGIDNIRLSHIEYGEWVKYDPEKELLYEDDFDDIKNDTILHRLIFLLLKGYEVEQCCIQDILITDTQFLFPTLQRNRIADSERQFPKNDSIFCDIISTYDNIRHDDIRIRILLSVKP